MCIRDREVDTVAIRTVDWDTITRGEWLQGRVFKTSSRGKEKNQTVGATDGEKLFYHGERMPPGEEEEQIARGEKEDRGPSLTSGERGYIATDLLNNKGKNGVGWNRNGVRGFFGDGVNGGYCVGGTTKCTTCSKSVCEEEGLPLCRHCTRRANNTALPAERGCIYRQPCPDKAPAAARLYDYVSETDLQSAMTLFDRPRLTTAEKVDLLDCNCPRKRRADEARARTLAREPLSLIHI